MKEVLSEKDCFGFTQYLFDFWVSAGQGAACPDCENSLPQAPKTCDKAGAALQQVFSCPANKKEK